VGEIGINKGVEVNESVGNSLETVEQNKASSSNEGTTPMMYLFGSNMLVNSKLKYVEFYSLSPTCYAT
jgi:hypothetical protein